ncbi:MAG: hypothetical protein GPJ54_12670 [Candidatus Heimdallarchaeota archaeon]|nr:hypothetical protein [Candidatus Heimdallarchaeota archaeon]
MLIVSTGIVEAQGDETETQSIDLNFGKSTEKEFSFETSNKPTLPDIGGYSTTNLSSFPVEGSTVYGHNDVVTEINQPFYQITVTLVAIYIVDDHDGTLQGAGEIFLQGGVNGNKSRFPSATEYAINNGENITAIDEIVLFTKAKSIDIKYEVRESDPGSPDDSLGFVSYVANPANESVELITDLTDARVYFDIYATLLGNSITAGELLQGYQPFIYVDDETSATEMPDYVVGRVISGNDQGTSALVLQYYYYWATENSPDGGIYSFELHKNDFEAVLIYLDTSNIDQPYRVVFNSWQYSNLDEFPSENILILEKGALPSNLNYVANISSDLQVLLGGSTELNAITADYNAVHTWEYNTLLNLHTDAEITSLYGFKTLDMTVDTSYHTFDLGPGGIDYGYNYTVQALNTSKLQEWYAEVGDTFDQGTHQWSFFGLDVPIVAPFAHDVNQVFAKPYIISAYKNVVEDAGALTVAKDSYLNTTSSLTVGIGFNIPATVEVTYPKSLDVGTNSIEFELKQTTSDTYIEISYEYFTNISFAYWFMQANFEMSNNGSMKVNMLSDSVTSVLDALGLSSWEKSDVPFNDYVTLDSFVISPKILGTIISGEISVDLWSVLQAVIEAFYPPSKPVFRIANFFIDSLSLTASFAMASDISHTISSPTTGVTLSKTEITYTEDTLIQAADLTIDSVADLSSDVDVIVGTNNYGLTFTTDWSLTLAFKLPVSLLVPDLVWDIGTFPTLSADLLSSPGDTLTIQDAVVISSTSSTTSSTTTPPTSTEDSDGGDSSLNIIVFGLGFMVLSLIYRRRT